MTTIFGGGSNTPQVTYQPNGIFSHTGYSISPGGNISQSPELTSNIGSLQSTFGQAAGAFQALGQTVAPGFSKLRQAGLADIGNTFAARRSNLQDTLAQRRILGSSFGNSQFNQLAADEAQTKANFEAEAYLKEFAAYQEATTAQFNAATQQFSSYISQQNIEASTAASLTAANNQIAAGIAETNAQLQAKAQAGAGSFMGTLLGLGTGGGNSIGGSIFGGLGSGLGSLTSNLGIGLGDLGGATAAGATAFNASTDAMLADAALLFAV